MMSLVGKYLVVTGAGQMLKNGNWVECYGHWSVMESPSGNGRDWQMLEFGKTDEPMQDLERAQETADTLGIVRARELQNDPSLHPLPWRVPFPDVPK